MVKKQEKFESMDLMRWKFQKVTFFLGHPLVLGRQNLTGHKLRALFLNSKINPKQAQKSLAAAISFVTNLNCK